MTRDEGRIGELLTANWRLSFGDLLTLILCFFISLAHQGARPKVLSQKVSVPDNNTLQETRASLENLKSSSKRGIGLANPGNGRDVRQFWLRSSMFQEGGGRLREDSRQEVERFLAPTANTSEQIAVRICGQGTEGVSQSFYDHLGRTLQLTEELNEMISNPERLFVELRTDGCDERGDLIELLDDGLIYG
ncbi:MAG: hypothetical protein KDD64_13480 [Bdellovibrionales bacterium]|nr:hypothetical protein [Bdellovibrionales bacterium]